MELRDKNGLTEQEFLAAYRPKDYERPSLTADIAVFAISEERTKILLVQRGNHPYLGRWALPGGFANKNEAVEDTAARELAEETGLTGLGLSPVGLFSKPGRDPRMWVVSQAFVSLIPYERIAEVQAGDDAAAARWFDIHTEISGCHIRLRFESGETVFEVRLRREVGGSGICSLHDTLKVLENGGLAFDHAQMIGCAMKEAGLL